MRLANAASDCLPTKHPRDQCLGHVINSGGHVINCYVWRAKTGVIPNLVKHERAWQIGYSNKQKLHSRSFQGLYIMGFVKTIVDKKRPSKRNVHFSDVN